MKQVGIAHYIEALSNIVILALSGGETWTDLLGATQAVCRLMGGSRTKSLGGSSRDELGT
jgi:hypothetical protein